MKFEDSIIAKAAFDLVYADYDRDEMDSILKEIAMNFYEFQDVMEIIYNHYKDKINMGE